MKKKGNNYSEKDAVQLLLNSHGENAIVNSSKVSNEIKKQKEFTTRILSSLRKPTSTYAPDETIKIIQDYLKNTDLKIHRVLYSEISSECCSLSDEDVGSVRTNLQKLLDYSLDNLGEEATEQANQRSAIECSDNQNKETEEESAIINVIIRFYDHFELATLITHGAYKDAFEQMMNRAIADLRIEIANI